MKKERTKYHDAMARITDLLTERGPHPLGVGVMVSDEEFKAFRLHDEQSCGIDKTIGRDIQVDLKRPFLLRVHVFSKTYAKLLNRMDASCWVGYNDEAWDTLIQIDADKDQASKLTMRICQLKYSIKKLEITLAELRAENKEAKRANK